MWREDIINLDSSLIRDVLFEKFSFKNEIEHFIILELNGCKKIELNSLPNSFFFIKDKIIIAEIEEMAMYFDYSTVSKKIKTYMDKNKNIIMLSILRKHLFLNENLAIIDAPFSIKNQWKNIEIKHLSININK